MPEQELSYTFVDLSSPSDASLPPSSDPNPYNVLIHACADSASSISTRYATHRLTRSLQQRTTLLSTAFPGPTIDPTLRDLLAVPPTPDPRNCLVLWARPPTRIRTLVATIQARLHTLMPHFWLMPEECLHMTALEFAHSRTEAEIEDLVQGLKKGGVAGEAVDWTYTQQRRARLGRPMVTYDAAAVALSFLPDEAGGEEGQAETYTYHHLRRDLWDLCSESSLVNVGGVGKEGRAVGGVDGGRGLGVPIVSRYTVPSAHLTIARFVTAVDVTVDSSEEGDVDTAKMEAFVEEIEKVNRWLEEGIWGKEEGEWDVGEEKGHDFRKGTLWYGGGETVLLGKGF